MGVPGSARHTPCRALRLLPPLCRPRSSHPVPRRLLLPRQSPARVLGRVAVLAELGQDVLVLVRAGDDGDVREVLRRGTEHGRAADIDHLDDLRFRSPALCRDRCEWIEVDADEVDRRDVVLGQRVDVLGKVASREDSRVDARMERLDAPTEHLRRLRHVLDRRHVETLLLEERCHRRRRAPSRAPRARARTGRCRPCRRR